jgi:integrase/recombinase XerD
MPTPSQSQPKQPAVRTARSGPRAAKTRPKAFQYLSTEEIHALFSVITNVRDRAIFRLAYHRGLRASEVGMLDLADYCVERERLYVRRLKGSYSGEYLLVRSEREALKRWVKKRGRVPGALFLSRNHRGISRWALDELMKKYCALANIPREKAHMHALKHSCGTHLLMREGNIMLVKDHLGHVNLQNTNLYAHVTNRGRDELAERNEEWT